MLPVFLLDILLLSASAIMTWYFGFNTARYSSLTRLIKDIAKDGVEYWQLPHGKAKYLEQSIKLRVGYLSSETESWANHPTFVCLLKAFRDAITDGQFETNNRSMEDRANRISNASEKLLGEIDRYKIPMVARLIWMLKSFWKVAFKY